MSQKEYIRVLCVSVCSIKIDAFFYMCFLESQGCIPLVSVCFLRLNAWMRQEEFTPELSPPFSTQAPDLTGLVPSSLVVSLSHPLSHCLMLLSHRLKN